MCRQIQFIMKKTIDIKSALAGLAAGVLVTLAIAAASSPSTNGRFQIAGTSNQGLILDTQTGRVWSGYFPPNQGRTDPDFFSAKIDEKK